MSQPVGENAAEYVLGTDDQELARLGLQHRLWAEFTTNLWERSGLKAGHRVLDVGCGPGFAALDLARLVGAEGGVVGVDESARYVERLRAEALRIGLRNVEALVGDVQRLSAAGVKAGSFDAAYARWVLCFVPDPLAVMAGVSEALRPGGMFMVQDYFNYERATALAPFSPIFARIVEATGRSWRVRGGDPDIAGRIPGLMIQCGMDVKEIRPVLRAARPGSLLWQWPTSFWAIFAPKLVEMGLISKADETAFASEWRARSNDPAAFFSTPPVYEIVGVKR